MKLYLFIVISSSVFVSQAQQLVQKNYIPGCMPIRGDYLYMSINEVSNIQYKEFIYWLKTNEHDSVVRKMMPDTNVWLKAIGYNEAFKHYYYQHAAYRDYPVVGITQKQAQAFCIWAQNRILENFSVKNIPVTKIIVRLPTTKEWEFAARGGQDNHAIYPWPGEGIRVYREKGWRKKDEGKIKLNCRETGLYPTPAGSYWPNGFGLYNMSGNVAEWVSEKNSSKGGSWLQSAWHARIPSPGRYDEDSSARCDVGFRYVVELVSAESKRTPVVKLDKKWFNRYFSRVDTHLLAGKYEVTNALYNQFLNENPTENRPEDSLWLPFTRYQYSLMYSSHSAFSEYPAVNITYEQATAFCNWLTELYHKNPKREYQKIKFRLPNVNEWQNAAWGGNIRTNYPWGGPYIRNSKGCFLANFSPVPESAVFEDSLGHPKMGEYDISESRKADGLEFTGPVSSYFPNGYGLFCMSGNVAEMTQDSSICKGGSWNSAGHFLMVNSGDYYPAERISIPSPMAGFRVFMEILEK